MTGYRYLNLTSAIGDKASPLRQYLDLRFPNARPLQKDYRSRAGELRVAGLPGGGGANGGTLGAAFDFRMHFLLDPGYIPQVAIRAFQARPDYVEAIHEVIRHGREAAQANTVPTELDRACWALALCTEVYRAGLFPGSPLNQLLEYDDFTPAHLLSLIPEDAFRQLTELNDLAQEYLFPHLSAPFHLGPTFDGSVLCPADADVISNGFLLDFKTAVRGNALSREDLYQLLGYTLFDHSDKYGINRIGIYSARYGVLVSWELELTLELLAGEAVNLAEEREKVWGLLGGGGAIRSKFARIAEADDAEYDDHSAHGEDDDSGYGPDSYYTRASGKDDRRHP
ncbi:hypothetical protein [Jatrophihabitans lederbergiae]|uniref:Restriction endonuclease n=1 Tax=Jatrophihabitans lederbergiae TaxID=3075547 RepID=A0ABU2JGU2_9ACTN|nr:hypothetical protein [Jatrophihabitans sp. DSM 44399]MDT0264198.1 hypothetical protein [Jatrophihabitans sp. DSM 44399]